MTVDHSMLATTHAVAGAIFASQFTNPWTAIIVSILSHPFLDLFPHWDLNTRWSKRSKLNTFILSAADCSLGLILGFIIFWQITDPYLLFTCMISAQLPDFLETPYHFGWEKNWFFKGVKKAQHLWHTKANFPEGFIPQILIICFGIWLRFK